MPDNFPRVYIKGMPDNINIPDKYGVVIKFVDGVCTVEWLDSDHEEQT